jgi:hypothetical protein
MVRALMALGLAGGTDEASSVPLRARTARPIGAAKPRDVPSRAEAVPSASRRGSQDRGSESNSRIIAIYVNGFRTATPVGS